MINKIKQIFNKEIHLSKFLFAFFILLLFNLIFGPNLYAQFSRSTGSVGWGYGYGYGYGYNYGWDGGTTAGYRTGTEGGVGLSEYGYGRGYGNMLAAPVGGVYPVTASNLASLVSAGLAQATGGATTATAVTFTEPVSITTSNDYGTVTITIPDGLIITPDSGTMNFTALAATNSLNEVSVSGLTITAGIQYGIPGKPVTLSAPISIDIPVGAALNGQTLNIYRSNSATSDWVTTGLGSTTCVVASGNCSLTTTKLSYFVAGTATSNRPSSSGGTYTPIVTIPEVSINAGTATVLLNNTTGTIVTLNSGATMEFTLGATSHTLRVTNIYQDRATAIISVASNPITVTLKLNEINEVDVDGDGAKDIALTLQQIISDTKIKFLVKQLAVTPVVKKDETVAPEEKKEETTVTTVEPLTGITITENVVPVKPEQNIKAEIAAIKAYIGITRKLPRLSADWTIIDFLAYGSINKTKTMTATERLTVLKDYKEVYGSLPTTTTNWKDLANIVSNKKPVTRVLTKEIDAIKAFIKIFKKLPQFSILSNDNFVQEAAYRLQPETKNTALEKSALAVFTKAYRKSPNTNFLKAVMRAIAYSGMLNK